TKDKVMDQLKHLVRREFINRSDEVVMFTPLSEENIKQLVKIQLKGIFKMIADQHITMDATPEAISYLAHKGVGSHFGARPVKRESKRSEEHTSELQSRENIVCR